MPSGSSASHRTRGPCVRTCPRCPRPPSESSPSLSPRLNRANSDLTPSTRDRADSAATPISWRIPARSFVSGSFAWLARSTSFHSCRAMSTSARRISSATEAVTIAPRHHCRLAGQPRMIDTASRRQQLQYPQLVHPILLRMSRRTSLISTLVGVSRKRSDPNLRHAAGTCSARRRADIYFRPPCPCTRSPRPAPRSYSPA